jgi:PPOX class probable F420-dependent enzyme
MGQLTMTKDEREAFLADVHIGVLAVNADGVPSVTPIWYVYEPGGDIVIHTASQSPKTAALIKQGRASLCAQTEAPPYKYVVVEGPVTVDEDFDESVRHELAYRYLGQEVGDMYLAATAGEAASGVTVRLTPERWRTTDYSKQFG